VAPGPAPAAPPGRGPSRKVLAVAALGAAVVLLAAGAVAAVAALRPVSSGHADPPPPAPAAAAAPMTGPRLAAEILAQTRVAGSGKYQMRIEIPGDEPSMVHNGEFRYLRDQVSVSVEEVYEGIPTATIVLDGQSWHMPPVGGTPGMTAAQPWLDCPSSDPDFERYCQIPALRQDDADPGGMLSLLGDTVTIEKSAPDNLAGTSAIRYDLRIDWDAAEIRETDPARRARITFNGRGSRPEPSVLWVDEQHRPLRWERDEVMILDYYGWGEPVVITSPPAELTVSR
jgi:hypothetical protein